MPSHKITIDGTNYTDSVDGLQDYKTTYRLGSSRTVSYQTSSELTFTFDAFNYLEQKLVKDQSFESNKVIVKIFPDCCNKTHTYTTTVKDIDYKPDVCEITVNLVRDSEDANCYKKLSSTLVYEDGFEENVDYLKIFYCRDIGFMNYLLFAILPVLGVGGFLESILNFVGIDTPLPNLGDIRELLSGCVENEHHTVQTVKNYVEYHADKCGLKLNSTILQTRPFDKLIYFDAPTEGCKGCKVVKGSRLNLTITQLLERISTVFAADYRIKDSEIQFEQETKFRDVAVILFNIQDAIARGQIDISENPPTYSRIEAGGSCFFTRIAYTPDILDQDVGNLMEDFSVDIYHNDVVNEQYNGRCDRTFDFSPTRMVKDRTDVGGFIGSLRDRYKGRLLLKSGQTATPRLLVWDGTTEGQGIKIQRRGRRGGIEQYNYNLILDLEDPDSLLPLLKSSLPNSSEVPEWEVDQIEWLPENFCNAVDILDQNGIDVAIETSLGRGIAEEIIVDWNLKTITPRQIEI